MCVQPEILFRKSAGSKRIDEREPPTYPWRGMEMAAKSPRDAPVSSSDSLNWIVRFSGTERRERRNFASLIENRAELLQGEDAFPSKNFVANIF